MFDSENGVYIGASESRKDGQAAGTDSYKPLISAKKSMCNTLPLHFKPGRKFAGITLYLIGEIRY